MSFPLKQYINQAERADKSPEFIEATVKYAQGLDEKSYPVIFSIEHLAMLMGIESGYFRKLIGDKKNTFYSDDPFKYFRYNYFKLKKRDGSYREIMAPSKDLKYIQKWILFNILEKYPLQDCCKGFRKKVSIYDNAKPHQQSDVILKVDLLKFYDTITEKRVYGVFKNMGYIENLSYSLAKITTAEHRFQYWRSFGDEVLKTMGYDSWPRPAILPQGAPSSPALANIVASRMDSRFLKLSKKLNFEYTRYADDLTFSIKKEGILPSLKLIDKIITDEGFFINSKKTQYLKKGIKQYVTGLTVDNGVNVSKKYRKQIAQELHFCRRFGVEQHLMNISKSNQKPSSILVYHDVLYGHICFIQSINKKAGAKLFEEFNKIDWFI